MIKQTISALVAIVFLSNQTLALAQSPAPAASNDVVSQMQNILESADQNQLAKMDSEVNGQIAQGTSLVSSPKHDRLLSQWTKRLATLSQKTIVGFNKAVDVMSSAELTALVEKSKAAIQKLPHATVDSHSALLTAMDDSGIKAALKNSFQDQVSNTIPKIASLIADDGGIVPYVLHLKQNLIEMKLGSKNQSLDLSDIEPCVYLIVGLSVAFIGGGIVLGVLVPASLPMVIMLEIAGIIALVYGGMDCWGD